jgi:hypothetical protein
MIDEEMGTSGTMNAATSGVDNEIPTESIRV